MIDPVTAFAAANAAFKGVKMLVGAGREMQDVSKQLGQWYCAVADITKAETQRKNPTWLDKKTHGTDNIEQEAMDIVIRKKTLLEKEKEIKFMLDYRFGLGTYDEMLGMRRKIRAEREETVYKAMEAKRQIQNNMAIGGLSLGYIVYVRWWYVFNNVGYTMINALILSVTLAGVANPTHVQCHLWKRFTDENGQKVCVYRFTAGMVAWGITTLQRVFLSVPRCLVVFMRRRTNALVCQKY